MINNPPATSTHSRPSDTNQQGPQRTANASKIHDNRAVYDALLPFRTYSELVEAHPRADCILTGTAWLMTSGHTATRPLARKVLFHVLAGCPWITTSAVAESTTWRAYSRTQLERYAAAARVASTALQMIVAAGPLNLSLAEEQRRIDIPHQAALLEARIARNPPIPFPHLIEEEPSWHLQGLLPGVVALKTSAYDLQLAELVEDLALH
jgi:hypothetical protein